MMNKKYNYLDYQLLFGTTNSTTPMRYEDVLKMLIRRADITELRKNYLMPEYLSTSKEEILQGRPTYSISKGVITVLSKTIGGLYIPQKEKYPDDYEVHQKLLSIHFFVESMAKVELSMTKNQNSSNKGCLGVAFILIITTFVLFIILNNL